MQTCIFLLITLLLSTGLTSCGHKGPPKPPDNPPAKAEL